MIILYEETTKNILMKSYFDDVKEFLVYQQ